MQPATNLDLENSKIEVPVEGRSLALAPQPAVLPQRSSGLAPPGALPPVRRMAAAIRGVLPGILMTTLYLF